MFNLGKTLIVVASIVCYAVTSEAIAQVDFQTLLTMKGREISKGSNSSPSGGLGATTYRLEIVTSSLGAEKKEDKVPENKWFRLTINTDKKLPMEVFSIWIDGQEYFGAEQVGPKSVAILIQAKALPSGSSLGLSVRGEKNLADRSVLPETLFVPPDYATPLSEIEASKPIVKLTRVGEGVEVRIENSEWLPASNHRIVSYEIEGYDPGPNPVSFVCDTFCIWIPTDKFARIRDGAEIRKAVQTGDDVTTTVVGRLDKGTLQ